MSSKGSAKLDRKATAPTCYSLDSGTQKSKEWPLGLPGSAPSRAPPGVSWPGSLLRPTTTWLCLRRHISSPSEQWMEDHWPWLPSLGHCARTLTGSVFPVYHHSCHTHEETEAQRGWIT